MSALKKRGLKGPDPSAAASEGNAKRPKNLLVRNCLFTSNSKRCFSRDPNGATIALFNLHLHEPTDVTHQTVLQCVVFQVQ